MKRINRFWTVVLTLAAVYLFIKFAIPALSRQVTDLPFPLPVPSSLVFIYMVLTCIALFLFVTFDDGPMNEFLGPIKRLLRGEFGSLLQWAVPLIVVPAVVGWYVYDSVRPVIAAPSPLRIQHPSSNVPIAVTEMENPYMNPSPEAVDAFIAEAKSGEVAWIDQVLPDLEYWKEVMEEMGTEVNHDLEAVAIPPMKAFLAQLEGGDIDRETARLALMEKSLFEGRALYAMNCRACHGDSVHGDGPMADGFKLRPINFSDTGTLETIVVGYTFWRVANGGPGLPPEATPWDSAMPEWKLNLTEEQRWKIIMAEYFLAGKTPRIPEKH